jgi:hypothetical protein
MKKDNKHLDKKKKGGDYDEMDYEDQGGRKREDIKDDEFFILE